MIRRESIRSHISINIEDASQVGASRRVATMLAHEAEFSDTEAGKVAIVATELATNIVKHAGRGEILVRGIQQQGIRGIEIVALDKGPGISDMGQSMRDGFSTSGTPGTGLGAIRRLASTFEVYTAPKLGTCALAQLWAGPLKPEAKGRLSYGVVCRPIHGEEVCGDCWGIDRRSSTELVMVADGLGHGPSAAEASEEAVRVLHENATRPITDILELAHGALRSTRGAAVAVAEISNHEQVVRFTGVGNISAAIWSEGLGRSLVSHNGIVGHQFRKSQEFQYPWPKGSILIMASDGLHTQWNLEKYPGLLRRHPGLTAAVLYRDYCRGRDDATVLVACEGSS